MLRFDAPLTRPINVYVTTLTSSKLLIGQHNNVFLDYVLTS